MKRIVHLLAGTIVILTALGLLARFVPPQVLWPPAIIALLLPGLLLFTVAYLSYLVYRKHWKRSLLPGLVVIFALPLLPSLFALNGPAPITDATANLVVGTFNVRGFRTQGWADASDRSVGDIIANLNADILFLQEYRHTRKSVNLHELIRENAALARVHNPDGKQIATYADTLTAVTSAFKKFNGYVVSDIRTELGTVRVVNAHLFSNRISNIAGGLGQDSTVEAGLDRLRNMFTGYGTTARIRAEQAEAIRKIVRESPHPVIVGGDFNDVPSSYTVRQVKTDRLRDAWVEAGFGPGTTFAGKLPGLRIDYLLVDTAFQIEAIDRWGEAWSDHRPLTVRLSR